MYRWSDCRPVLDIPVDCREKRTCSPETTNVGAVRNCSGSSLADVREAFGQRVHFFMTRITRHQKHVRKRARLEFTVDSDRPSGVRVGLSSMRSDFYLVVSVGFAVDTWAHFLFPEAPVLAAFDKIDSLGRVRPHAKELLDHGGIEVNLMPSKAVAIEGLPWEPERQESDQCLRRGVRYRQSDRGARA